MLMKTSMYSYQQETSSITNFVIRIKKLCKNLIFNLVKSSDNIKVLILLYIYIYIESMPHSYASNKMRENNCHLFLFLTFNFLVS